MKKVILIVFLLVITLSNIIPAYSKMEYKETCGKERWCVNAIDIDAFSDRNLCIMNVHAFTKEDDEVIASLTMGKHKKGSFIIKTKGEIDCLELGSDFPYNNQYGFKIDNGEFIPLSRSGSFMQLTNTCSLTKSWYPSTNITEAMKKGHNIYVRLTEYSGIVKLTLNGFTKTYKSCEAVIKGQNTIK